MWYVYFIKSKTKNFLYIGTTNNVNRRIYEHNTGLTQSTKSYLPFELLGYIAVRTKNHAERLEKYFKTGSGKAVLKKRILPDEALA